MSEFHERLSTLAALWNKIEKRAKAAEQFRGESIIAAINEMRYAGRRVVDAWAVVQDPAKAAGREAEVDENLILAKNYLINADHDITDAVCFIVLKRVSAVVEQYGVMRIITIYPGFAEQYKIVKEAQAIIQGSREDRATRIAGYEKLADEYQPKLEILYNELVKSSLLALRDPETSLARRTWAKIDVLQTIAIIGAGSGVAALLLEIYDIFFLRAGRPL